jgi:hypothetical protein
VIDNNAVEMELAQQLAKSAAPASEFASLTKKRHQLAPLGYGLGCSPAVSVVAVAGAPWCA